MVLNLSRAGSVSHSIMNCLIFGTNASTLSRLQECLDPDRGGQASVDDS